MAKSVIIIGGGVIGLCSAYYLSKKGHQVTIVDQSNLSTGTSYINAGLLAPSHIIPLAAPGVMKKGLKWMFNKSSPLYIKPRLDFDFFRWILAFNKSCNLKHVQKSIPAIKEMTLLSQELYDAIKKDEQFTFHYKKKGLLMLCKTSKVLEEEIKVAQRATQEGISAKVLSFEELKVLQPNLSLNTIGATYHTYDSHTTPEEFMEEMKRYLKQVGVRFLIDEKVEDIALKNQKILTVITNVRQLKADAFVLAAGSWSHTLSKKIGLKLLLQAGKGYSINTIQTTGITIPSILTEAKVAVTPMNGFTRFAGTMEIAGISHKINKTRVEAIAKAVKRYYPDIELTTEEKHNATSGLRPLSPDGMPYIGKSSICKNLTIATGHAMMGWSMATGTGKLVSELVSEEKPTLSLEPFHPDRRF